MNQIYWKLADKKEVYFEFFKEFNINLSIYEQKTLN